MRHAVASFAALIAITAHLAAQPTERLPVQKVVLYKNGMGYFQHLGSINGDEPVDISLPSSQLNDVLKSLTILDLDGGRVFGVSYDSAVPLERRLLELPIDFDSVEGLVEFLEELRGSRVEAGSVAGRILGAEKSTRTEGPNVSIEVIQLSIFTDSGEVRIVELDRTGGFKLVDPALSSEVSRFLEFLDEAKRRDTRRLQIQTRGSGQRRLFLSYTAEAPIWKTTYRIVLDAARKTLLQGWAIVDNTSAMDWNGVELSLVSGAPISFIQELSQPIYGNRPVIPVMASPNLSPEVHEGAMDEKVFPEESRVAEFSAEFGRRAARSEMAALAGGVSAAPPPAPELGEAIRRGAFDTAAGAALAEQFEYRLSQPVTVKRNQSALLSILQAEADAEKVSVFDSSGSSRHPRLAVWLKNTTGSTLDGGAFSVVDTNAFAGEGIMETIQPNERRLLSYAIDLAVEVASKKDSEFTRVERVVASRGVLRLDRKLLETTTYTVRNNADKARAVLIEHPQRTGWTVTKPSDRAEVSANLYRFRVAAGPASTSELKVEEERPEQSQYLLTNVTSDLIGVWVRERSIDSETEKRLREIATRKAEISDLDKKIAALAEKESEIFRDQGRVRENLSRLARSPEETQLRQRYIDQLNSQEDQLAELRSERQRQEQQRNEKQAALNEFIENLALDRRI